MCVRLYVGVCAYWGYCCCYCQHYKLITNWAEFKSRQAQLSALIPQAAMEQRLNKSSKINCSFRCWQHNCFCCVKTLSRIQTNTHMHTHLQRTNIAHANTHTHTHMHEHALCLSIPSFQQLFSRFTGSPKCIPSISCSRSVAAMENLADLVPCWWALLTAWWTQSRRPIEYYIRHRPRRFLTVGYKLAHVGLSVRVAYVHIIW